MPVDSVDIAFHVIDRSYGKPSALIHRTEGTVVPGAVSGHTDKKTICFARRPYGTLFKTLIRVGCFIAFLHFHILRVKIHIDRWLSIFSGFTVLA